MDYNKTINLPKTDFPMRASLPTREPGMLKNWQDDNIYTEMLKKNEGKPRFILHDGPPFSNGLIHMGHALNKVLKDFLVRYKAMCGFYTPMVPGWDNHGMPIESAIIKKQKLDRKKMSVPEFRDACAAFAMDFVNKQMDQFKRLGIVGDWEHPYLTMSRDFEANEVKVFGKMYEKGYIYKGLKPVYWCIHDETALAEAEIEYQDDPCESIYVRFAVKDDKGLLNGICDVKDTCFVIWTTTTWSLPGNLAIALNPAESYVVVKTSAGNIIIAEALMETVLGIGGYEGSEVLARFKGSDLEGMIAMNPLFERDSLVVTADYVTMDSGTGCVHTAPGFGMEDYMTGKRYGLDILVPIDDKGFMTADAHQFEGMFYEKANEAILEHLRNTGALYASQKIVHSYAHCWRCKHPLLYRATSQWFCSVDAFKDAAVAAADEASWVPEWGRQRIVSMIRDRADWCISRQRQWGLPIPVFTCEDCGKPVCTPETIDHVSELFRQHGSNIWFKSEAKDLLPEAFVCPHCGGVHFSHDNTTLDGWFDSGSTHYSFLECDDAANWPADVYLEGADQYRGWFQSSLLTAIGMKGGKAPYKTVITHGWVVDGEGKAMHKSIGNTIDPNDIVKENGADLLRLWVASSEYKADVRVSKDIFKQLSQAYLKIRNTMRFILGNLDGFDPADMVKPEEMTELDRWAITKLNELIERCRGAYESYDFHIVYHSIYDFCVVEMSNFYLDIIKDRLYCDSGVLRRSAQTAIYKILSGMVRLLAPMIPFTADEVWKAMPHTAEDDARNILYNSMAEKEDGELGEEAMNDWARLKALRDDVNMELEAHRAAKTIGKSLEAAVVLNCSPEAMQWLSGREELLKTMFIVSSVKLVPGTEGKACESCPGVFVTASRATGEKCERCWTYDATVGQDAEHPGLCARCAAVVKEKM